MIARGLFRIKVFSIRRLLYFFAAFVDRCGEIAGLSALPLARGAFTLYLDSAPRRRGTLDRTSVHWDRESASPTIERDSSYLDERRVLSFLTPCFCLLAFRANEITWSAQRNGAGFGSCFPLEYRKNARPQV